MARHVFRYKPVQGRLAPMITVGIKLAETWYPIGMYVDSGAAYTLLHANIAQGAGFPYRTGQPTYLQVGDGSFIPVYLHDLELQLGAERFVAKVGFSERLGSGVQSAWQRWILYSLQDMFSRISEDREF
jgi:hypothetical protein